MSEAYKIALTSMATVAVLVCGQILIRSLIEPLYELRRAIGKIHYILLFYANIYANPGSTRPEMERKVGHLTRHAACLLAERTRALPWHGFFAAFHLVPPKRGIDEAVKQLIGLSNTVGFRGHEDQNQRRIATIKSTLKLPGSP